MSEIFLIFSILSLILLCFHWFLYMVLCFSAFVCMCDFWPWTQPLGSFTCVNSCGWMEFVFWSESIIPLVASCGHHPLRTSLNYVSCPILFVCVIPGHKLWWGPACVETVGKILSSLPPQAKEKSGRFLCHFLLWCRVISVSRLCWRHSPLGSLAVLGSLAGPCPERGPRPQPWPPRPLSPASRRVLRSLVSAGASSWNPSLALALSQVLPSLDFWFLQISYFLTSSLNCYIYIFFN